MDIIWLCNLFRDFKQPSYFPKIFAKYDTTEIDFFFGGWNLLGCAEIYPTDRQIVLRTILLEDFRL